MDSKPYIGQIDLEERVFGRHLSCAKEFDWGKVGGRYGYDWAPVIDGENIIVDVMDIDGDNDIGEHTLSFVKSLPVKWDGHKGAYRVVA